ncbi:MAG TPA: hypothetical protein VN226_03910 [Anaerolineales bacterium]|nr:hypothetical protein [Anaerolineales bacterium]
MEHFTNNIDRKAVVVVILLTLPFYCLGFFAWNFSPSSNSLGETPVITTITSTNEPTSTLIFTESGATRTPRLTHTMTPTITKTPTPTTTSTMTVTITASITPTLTWTPTETFTATHLPTETATEQALEFFTPTNLPDDILTIMP